MPGNNASYYPAKVNSPLAQGQRSPWQEGSLRSSSRSCLCAEQQPVLDRRVACRGHTCPCSLYLLETLQGSGYLGHGTKPLTNLDNEELFTFQLFLEVAKCSRLDDDSNKVSVTLTNFRLSTDTNSGGLASQSASSGGLWK